jgi:iron(III) transport system ATP-binding protein
VGTLNVLHSGEATEALLASLGIRTSADCWALRPERLTLGEPGASDLAGTVGNYTYLGREAQVQVETPVGPLIVHISDPGMAPARARGEPVSVMVQREALIAFGADGKRLAIVD